MLLKFSVMMEQLITDNKEEISFPIADANKFAEACSNMLSLHASLAQHFADEQTDLFTLTSKCHMLQHIALLSRCRSPRLATCGERKIMFCSLRSFSKTKRFCCIFLVFVCLAASFFKWLSSGLVLCWRGSAKACSTTRTSLCEGKQRSIFSVQTGKALSASNANCDNGTFR